MKPFEGGYYREPLSIAAELHGDPKRENQNPLYEERPGCKYTPESHGEEWRSVFS
jgi:hypothetical protein